MAYTPIGKKSVSTGSYVPLGKSFAQRPEDEDNKIDKGTAFTRAAAFQAIPTTGAIASGVGGAKLGALAGAPLGPIGAGIGAVVGAVGGGILGAVLTSKAQEKALEIVKGEEWMNKKQEQLAQAREDQPLASFAGEVAPQLLTMKPSIKTVGSAIKFAQNILTNPKSVVAILKTPAGMAQLDDLINVSIGGSAELGTEVYTQAKEGDFNALRLIAAGTVGSLINQPNRFGVRMGLKPSGEIEFTPEGVADTTTRAVGTPEAPVRTAPEQAIKGVDEPLLQEARKYKSAEEFVKALNDSPLTGNFGERFGVIDETRLPDVTSQIRKVGGREAVDKIKQLIQTGDKKIGAELADKIDRPYSQTLKNIYKDGNVPPISVEKLPNGKIEIVDGKHRLQAYRELGIKEIPIANISDTQSGFLPEAKSQLTDIWERANTEITPRTTEVSREQLPVGEGEKKGVSRLEARMKGVLDSVKPEKAEEAGITTYQQMNKADQIKKAVDYVKKNQDEALAVLRGDKPAPEGLLHNSIALALEQKASDTADANLAIKLASLRSTRAGQEISILTEADPSNPVNVMQEIIKARTEKLEKTRKTTKSKLVAKEVGEVKAEVVKKQLKIDEAEKLLAKLLC